LTLPAGAPGATLILAAMLLASLAGLYAMPALIERSLFRPHWLLPRGEYATLVTSGFMHADLTHLLFNAFTFFAFAFQLEPAMGTPRFLALYAAGLLASDALTWVRHRDDPGYQSLGASGAISAVLFASIVYFPNSAIYTFPIPFPIPAPLFALAYLAYCHWASRQAQGRINHDAHFGGAVAGLVFVALTDAPAWARAWHSVFG
jgi:membrane associated rhomboid family serine protease